MVNALGLDKSSQKRQLEMEEGEKAFVEGNHLFTRYPFTEEI
jgi:hypothetical protein